MDCHLITTYYHTSEEERSSENLECLRNNIENPLIKCIHLFLQSRDRPTINSNGKIIYIEHNKRPTFSELFSYANTLPAKCIKMISNSDIYFNDTIKQVYVALERWDLLSLSRWDINDEKCLQYYNNFKSQDVWIFRKTIPEDIGDYFIGQHGCDNRILFELKNKKISFGNPSLEIITIHLHKSNLRTYFNDPNYKRVDGPYEYALPVLMGKCKDEYIKYQLYYARYRYYKSLSSNTLPGLKAKKPVRLAAYFYSKLWAFLLNHTVKNPKYINSNL